MENVRFNFAENLIIYLLFWFFLNIGCSLWVWNLVADIAGGKEAEGIGEQGVEENIWT